MENKLKYRDKPIYMEGLIISTSDAALEIDLTGRLGRLKIPRRMLISDREIEVGARVGFMMTYPELLED